MIDTVTITAAKYLQRTIDTEDGTIKFNGINHAIQATIDGIQMSVPLDPANRHYAEIMRQVEAGTLTIDPAE